MGAAKIPEKAAERYHDPVLSGPTSSIKGYVDRPKGVLVEENAKLRHENEDLKNRDYYKSLKRLSYENQKLVDLNLMLRTERDRLKAEVRQLKGRLKDAPKRQNMTNKSNAKRRRKPGASIWRSREVTKTSNT